MDLTQAVQKMSDYSSINTKKGTLSGQLQMFDTGQREAWSSSL